MTKVTSFLIVVVGCLLLVVSVEAVGLQVKPSLIDLKNSVGEKFSTRVTVFNPAPEVSVFDVYPDSFESQIKTSPASFILESGESREVFVSFEFKEVGQFNTSLSIISRPLSKSAFSAGGGIKIPVSLTITDEATSFLASVFGFFGQNQDSLIGFLALVAIIALLSLGIKFFFRKKKVS